ncbi:MAG TPA: hypothetical protein VFR58_17610 [Flavisolibacter sp.]|nr:hypothetical protein [Flavisolibacter sp.]
MKTALQGLVSAFVFLAALLPLNAGAQDLTGIWRGTFQTYSGEEYRFELQIEQTKSNRISGVSYSFLDTRFYGKATVTGNFTKSTQAALIQEIKTVEVKMAGGSTACIMKCFLSYSASGREQFLEGTYTSIYETTDSLYGIRRGGNCGGGKLMLRKVTTSEFYTEPFLRNKTEQRKPDTLARKPVSKPLAKNTPAKPAPSKPAPDRKPAVTNAKPVDRPRTDTTKRIAQGSVEAPRPKFNIPASTRARENQLVQTVTVTSEEVSVRLYDNGEVDDDTISVYLDGKPIISNKRLSTAPITVTLKMDDDNTDHVLVMVAENMGRIPPNTSLMIVQDGDRRLQVSITSTEQKNAMVRFRYQKN